jgi:hypothetical protein
MYRSLGSAWLNTFDVTFIINRTVREDRRRQCMEEFGLLGLTVPDDRVRFFAAIESPSPGPFRNRGEHGCYLSHLNVIEELRKSPGKRFAILEDDFCFFRHFLRHGQEILDGLQRHDWDLAQLGPMDYDTSARFRRLPLWSERRYWGFGCHCYAVNQASSTRVAKLVAQHLGQETGTSPIDIYMNQLLTDAPDIRLRAVRRPAAFQRPSPSDLRALPSVRVPALLRPLADWAYTEFVRAKLF